MKELPAIYGFLPVFFPESASRASSDAARTCVQGAENNDY
jgi:hypothetical protein